MKIYQGEPIPFTLACFTDDTKETPVNITNAILELKMVRVSSDKAILVINNNQLIRLSENTIGTEISSTITQNLEPGEYRFQLKRLDGPITLDISVKTINVLKSH